MYRVLSLEESQALWSIPDSRNQMAAGAGDITCERSKNGLDVFWNTTKTNQAESESESQNSEAEFALELPFLWDGECTLPTFELQDIPTPPGSPAGPQQPSIQHKIKSLLLNIDSRVGRRILVQFWAPIRTASGQIMLTASHQPFGIGHRLYEGLCIFRKYCAEHQYGVSVEDTTLLGPLGRVFTLESPEFCRDVRNYSPEEFPLKKHALDCGILFYAALPLFERDGQRCVGVLELSSLDEWFLSPIKVVPLEKYDLDYQGHRCKWDETRLETRQTIRSLAQFVQQIYGLGLVQVWVPCLCHIAPDATSSGQYDAHNSCSSSNPPSPSPITRLFRDYCIPSEYDPTEDVPGIEPCWVRNDTSLVGRAYSQKKPCFVRDFSQFNLFDCPLLPFLRSSKLEACFAIPLQLIHPKFDPFVLELFLARGKNWCDRTLEATLELLLFTLKENCSTDQVQVEKFSVKLSHWDYDNIAYLDVYQNGSSDATAQERDYSRLNDHPRTTGETAMASFSSGVEVSPNAAEADCIQIDGSSDATARKRDYSRLNDHPRTTGETAMASFSSGVEVSPNAAEADCIQMDGSSDATARKRDYSRLNDHPRTTGETAMASSSSGVEVSPNAAEADRIQIDGGSDATTRKRDYSRLNDHPDTTGETAMASFSSGVEVSPNAAEADCIQIDGGSDATARKRDYSRLNDHPNATSDKAKTRCSRNVQVSPYAPRSKITLDDITPLVGLKLKDAAKKLGVCGSSLKRQCRDLGIRDWRSLRSENVHRIQSSPRSPTRFFGGGDEVIQESEIEPPCQNNNQTGRDAAASDTIPKSAKGKNIAAHKMDLDHSYTMIVKATYKDDTVKFHLRRNSRIEKLRRELDKRFRFKAERFKIKYEDEGDWILVSCNEDLRFRMDDLKSSGQTTMHLSIFPATL